MSSLHFCYFDVYFIQTRSGTPFWCQRNYTKLYHWCILTIKYLPNLVHSLILNCSLQLLGIYNKDPVMLCQIHTQSKCYRLLMVFLSMLCPDLASSWASFFHGGLATLSLNSKQFLRFLYDTPSFWVKLGSQIFQNMWPWLKTLWNFILS